MIIRMYIYYHLFHEHEKLYHHVSIMLFHLLHSSFHHLKPDLDRSALAVCIAKSMYDFYSGLLMIILK